MEALWQQVITGLSNGSIYAAMSLALVMVYQSTHRINFAQGEMATLSTFIAWALLQRGWPYWGAWSATVLGSFALGALIQGLLLARLDRTPALTQVGVGIGLLMIFNGLSGWWFDHTLKVFPSPFDAWPAWAGIPAHRLGMFGTVALLVAALWIMLHHSRLGLALRAVAHHRVASMRMGLPVRWLLAIGWGWAAAIGAIAGMLVAPIVFLEPNMMGGILIYALAGALLGGLNNPSGAVLGGLIVGLFETLLGAYLIGNALKLSAAMLLIVATLVLRPQGLFGQRLIERV